MVLENWQPHTAPPLDVARVKVTEGPHSLRLEYYQRTEGGRLRIEAHKAK